MPRRKRSVVHYSTVLDNGCYLWMAASVNAAQFARDWLLHTVTCISYLSTWQYHCGVYVQLCVEVSRVAVSSVYINQSINRLISTN